MPTAISPRAFNNLALQVLKLFLLNHNANKCKGNGGKIWFKVLWFSRHLIKCHSKLWKVQDTQGSGKANSHWPQRRETNGTFVWLTTNVTAFLVFKISSWPTSKVTTYYISPIPNADVHDGARTFTVTVATASPYNTRCLSFQAQKPSI